MAVIPRKIQKFHICRLTIIPRILCKRGGQGGKVWSGHGASMFVPIIAFERALGFEISFAAWQRRGAASLAGRRHCRTSTEQICLIARGAQVWKTRVSHVNQGDGKFGTVGSDKVPPRQRGSLREKAETKDKGQPFGTVGFEEVQPLNKQAVWGRKGKQKIALEA